MTCTFFAAVHLTKTKQHKTINTKQKQQQQKNIKQPKEKKNSNERARAFVADAVSFSYFILEKIDLMIYPKAAMPPKFKKSPEETTKCRNFQRAT